MPEASEVFSTLTSEVPEREPVPIDVSPTLIVTLPVVPLKPPKAAVTLVNFTLDDKVIEKLIELAGDLLEPI